MVREIMNHLEAIAKEQEEVSETGESNLNEKTREYVESYTMELESVTHLFRKSELMELLKQENKEKFDILWVLLEEVVYRAQKSLPDILERVSAYQKEDRDEDIIMEPNAGVSIRQNLLRLGSTLRHLIETFKKDGGWYEVFPPAQLSLEKQNLYRSSGLDLSDYAVEKHLLTTQQWRDLSEYKYVGVREVNAKNMDDNYAELLSLLNILKEQLASIENKPILSGSLL